LAIQEEEVLAAAVSGSLDRLVAVLDRHGTEQVKLVVDDLHTIAGTTAERALERFLELRPRSLRVILGSRCPPSINTSRLLANGELTQLDGEDLRFRSWEVEELFRLLYDQPLSPEGAAALTRRTGGWAAGLQLFHLATADLSRVEREQAVTDLSGRSRLIRSYLTRNVLDGLDSERRRFLLRTCTLGVLTGELCDQLLGTVGSAAVLAELERRQFFTTTTDDGLTFRYHQVLQSHLEVVLVDELGGQGARVLYALSGQLLEGDGRDTAAARAYARAEDWASVARLLQRSSQPVATGEDWARGVLGPLSSPSDDPSLLVAGARRLLRSGLVGEAVTAYRHAESLLDDPEFRERCVRERAVAALWLPDPIGLDARPTTQSLDFRQAVELRLLTSGQLGGATPRHRFNEGLGHLLAGDLAAAASVLEHTSASPSTPAWQRLAGRMVVLLADLVDDPSGAGTARLEEVVLDADVEGVPWLSRLARGIHAAAMLASQGDCWRVASCAELLADAERHGDPWAVCLLNGIIGAAHLAAGQAALGNSQLRRSAEVARKLHAPVLEIWAEVFGERAGESKATPTRSALLLRARALGLERAVALLEGAGPRPQRSSPDLAARAPASRVTQEPSRPVTIEVHCLGSFEITLNGVPAPWTGLRPRAQALLQLLSLQHGRRKHREYLIDALWPDATVAAGTRRLQVAVSSIRRWLLGAGLPDGCVGRHGDTYALDLPGATFQVERLEGLARDAGHHERNGDPARALADRLAALDLYTGDLLPEAGPADWVVRERDRLRTLAAVIGADAARTASGVGDLTLGVRLVRRSLVLDPYQDRSWRLLATLLDRMGDRSAAQRSRQEHAQALATLGLPPGETPTGHYVRAPNPPRFAHEPRKNAGR
jgi:DNA-binding SARP family transcriptional activator